MTSDPIRYATEIRVRYDEADPMGFVHHANYFRYFEYCRTELLRTSGTSYKEVEASGTHVVVVRANIKYRNPARYDDLLTVTITIPRIKRASIDHEYQIHRGGDLVCEAGLTLAVLDRSGQVQPIPDWMESPPGRPIRLKSRDDTRPPAS